ncbi:hypothetical protein BKA83DRAFT_1131484 [Pisolithus microcarpus]|nr:hypothetical protein BKA83DRAFT_1131484 [Pisolithus microcarpus]
MGACQCPVSQSKRSRGVLLDVTITEKVDYPLLFTILILQSRGAKPLHSVAFCQVFPNTCPAGSCPRRASCPSSAYSIFWKLLGSRAQVDNWANPERLTIFLGPRSPIEEFDSVGQWLETRQEFDLPKLHVGLTGLLNDLVNPAESSIFCSEFCCILELGRLPLFPPVHLST